MSITRDREKGTITISQKGYTEDMVSLLVWKAATLRTTPE